MPFKNQQWFSLLHTQNTDEENLELIHALDIDDTGYITWVTWVTMLLEVSFDQINIPWQMFAIIIIQILAYEKEVTAYAEMITVSLYTVTRHVHHR